MQTLKNESGASLLSVMMALTLFGGLMLAITAVFSNSQARMQALAENNDLRELRNFFNDSVDCAATIAARTSCDGSPIQLLDAKGRVLIDTEGAGNWSHYGRYLVRARCEASGILVEVSKSAKRTKRRDFAPLFKRSPFACAS